VTKAVTGQQISLSRLSRAQPMGLRLDECMEPSQHQSPLKGLTTGAKWGLLIFTIVLLAVLWIWTGWSWEEGPQVILFAAVLLTALCLLVAAQGRYASRRRAEGENRVKNTSAPWYLRIARALWTLVGIRLVAALYMDYDSMQILTYWFGFTAWIAYENARSRIEARRKRRQAGISVAQERDRPDGPRQRISAWWLERERPGFYIALAFLGLMTVCPAC
jgi:hypothetical protein